MNNKYLLILCGSIFLTGCSGAVASPNEEAVGQLKSTVRYQVPLVDYELVISPDFTPDQVQAILNAAEAWQEAVVSSGNHLIFSSSVGPECKGCEGVVNISPITFGALQATCTNDCVGETWNNDSNIGVGGWIELSVDNECSDIKMFYQVALHELGHSMGLVHTGASTAMCKDTTCGVSYITATDLKQWAGLRGIVGVDTSNL